MGITNDLNSIRDIRKTLFHLTMLTSIVATATSLHDDVEFNQENQVLQWKSDIKELPFCGDKNENTIGRRLLYVTTLDGRLSALDVTHGGRLRWSIPTGPGPLISSSIHRLELTNEGRFVRMIPSLGGGLYKFDGESINSIPINTDHLLSSSAKFSDELVISGGKETRTYGISVRTGKLLYECSMNGCVNSTDEICKKPPSVHDPLIDDVIVVRRQTQTVRAIESRTGIERWNFSVGLHDLDLIKPADCHERDFTDMDIAISNLVIRVIVPEGIICAFTKSDATTMLWKHKFNHPIVSAWRIGASDELESIDMFQSAQWLWEKSDADNFAKDSESTVSPAIYLGMYEKQLYIQESIYIRKEISDNSYVGTTDLYENNTNMLKIPWRPIAAGGSSITVVQDNKIIGEVYDSDNMKHSNKLQGNELVRYDDDMFALSAQSVLNASEYVNGNGYYFFTNDEPNKANEKAICDVTEEIEELDLTTNASEKTTNITENISMDNMNFTLDDIDMPVKVVILSLWFWWKEILVISITSAVLLNLFIRQNASTEREIVVIERHIPVPTAIEATESSTVAVLGPVTNSTTGYWSNSRRSISESTSHSGSEQFTSRFQSDFDMLRCLGRGGFGVVFEAKNKLDDCKYAVKRITLPNKKESRERVMREVKTLANCEHHNIVRYFQAWVENPPPGWQEEEDSKWLAQEFSSTSIQIDTPTDGSTHPSIPTTNVLESEKNKLAVAKKKLLMSWVSSVTNTACSNKPDADDDDGIEEDDGDSCIIFRSESESLALRDIESDVENEIQNNEVCYENSSKINRQMLRKAIRKSSDTAISIDIHSNNFDLGRMNIQSNGLDCSQLSDSFQIEFVRPASDIDGETENGDAYKEGFQFDTSKPVRRKPDKLSLDLVKVSETNNNNNSNDKQLSLSKSSQNKVYLYIQMQLCRKESLRDWLRDNRTDARVAHIGRIFYQIVDAVEYVHMKGLIHRDLKPSNIFFSQEGQIKIGDFGLVTDMSDIPNMVNKCADLSGLPSCVRHTQQVGTHLYMSPEQLLGKHYDFKVDIYSLGLILFELLVYFVTEMERIVTLRDLREGRYPKEFPLNHPGEYELLKQMLSPKAVERPTTLELKERLQNLLKFPDLIGDHDKSLTSIGQTVRSLSFRHS